MVGISVVAESARVGGVLNLLLGAVGAGGVVAIPSVMGATDTFLTIANDGTYTDTANGSGNWVTPTSAPVAANYQARASSLSGDTAQAVGTFDTWLDLSTTRQWAVNAGGFACTFTLEIRDKVSGVVRDSATCTVDTT